MKRKALLCLLLGMSLTATCYPQEAGGSQSFVINEIQTANIDQYIDYSNNYGGWIELYNPTATAVNVDNCYISNDPGNLLLHKLNSLGYITAGGYLIIYFDHNSADGNFSPNAHKQVRFKLDADGGTIYISDSKGHLITSVDYPASVSRCSFARTTDGGSTWRWTGQPTPGQTNTTSTFADKQLHAPTVTVPSGFLSGRTTVDVTAPDGSVVRYTTDGSTPTATSGNTLNGNDITISKTTTLRLRAFREGMLPSAVATHTYLFRDKDYYLPVISVVTDNRNLYDDKTGVYTVGTNGIAGRGIDYASNKNMDWERPVNFEYFTADGRCVLNQEADFSISGGWSRHWQPTSFKLKAEKQYEHLNTFDYPFFAAKPYIKSKAIVIRNGGNDTDNRIMDAVNQNILSFSGLYLENQAWQPAHVFLNGKYLAMLNIREPNNKHYAYSNYGYDSDESDAFELDPDKHTEVFKAGNNTAFTQLYNIARRTTSAENYEQIRQLLDIDEYANYMAAECYIGCSDWLTNNNNCKAFRCNGRFRYVMFDTDSAWDFDDMITRLKGNTQNRQTVLFNNLLRYDDFKQRFINAYCLMAGSVFEQSRVNKITDHVASVVKPALSLEGKDPTWRANDIKGRINDTNRRANRMSALKNTFGLGKGMTLRLGANIPQATLTLNGQQVPTGRFDGEIFPKATIEASAPAGYNFTGWEKGDITSSTLLKKGSSWYYHDSGSLDGTGWQTASIGWNKGASPLGYGKGGIATTISYGSDGHNKTPTYYFRQTVSLGKEPSASDRITLNFTADDGFIVYVNGKEAARYNMPDGDITYNTPAVSYAPGNPDAGTVEIDASLFRRGGNAIAVEVHNNAPTSSDIYWDAELVLSSISGTIVSTDRTYTFTQNEDCTLSAIFTRIPEEYLNAAGQTPVVINEISAGNTVFANEYYKRNDWVELYNTTAADIDLTGMYLSDDAANPRQYQILPVTAEEQEHGIIIPAHGFRIVWADKLDPLAQLHAPFKLANADGEQVVLTAADGSWSDTMEYKAHTGEESVGRYPDGGRRIYKMARPTIGKSNVLTSYSEWISGRNEDFNIEEYVAGMDNTPLPADAAVATEYFTVDGIRLNAPRRGINIVRRTHADGTVTTRRIMME